MKLQSFGCSFIYGTDLDDCPDQNGIAICASRKTWPALISARFGMNYRCRAHGGSGNLSILTGS
jgi:hypothetical protein